MVVIIVLLIYSGFTTANPPLRVRPLVAAVRAVTPRGTRPRLVEALQPLGDGDSPVAKLTKDSKAQP